MQQSSKFLYSILVAILISSASLIAQSPINQTVVEDDWWLPPYVQPTTNSGISFYGSFSPPTIHGSDLKLSYFRWRDVNPAEGVYDWSILQNDLNANARVYIRIDMADTMLAPQWLFTRYPWLDTLIFTTNGSYESEWGTSPGIFIPLWNDSVQAEIFKLLQNFKQQSFATNPKFHHAYFPFAWEWGEFARVDDSILIASGLTPQSYVDWFKGFCDTTLAAFHNLPHKLVMTGYDVMERTSSPPVGDIWRDSVGRQLTEYTTQLGFGLRTGLLEKFNFQHNDCPNLGLTNMSSMGKNYMLVSDSHPFIKDTALVYVNENEEFCYNANPCDYYHFKMSILRQLQLRMNWMYSNQANYQASSEMHDYFALTAGKKVDNSPDAWCALRQMKDVYRGWLFYPNYQNYKIDNWERWLYQREVSPGGLTKNTYLIDDNQYRLFNDTSHEAKMTQHASGNDFIYFNIDDNFIYNNTDTILIKITYLDNFSGGWNLEYDGSSNDYQSIPVTNTNDGNWKTVTLMIPDGEFVNTQTSGNDFRLYNGGSSDLTVRFVRIIKLKQPNPLTSTYTIDSDQSALVIYPNPNRGDFVEIRTNSFIQEVRIIDSFGKIVEKLQANRIPLESYQSGIYFISVVTNEKTYMHKLILIKE
jgi:hypothetical protein